MRRKIHFANAITASRILFAAAILPVRLFSVPFYVLYLLGAVTDMVDGAVARALGEQSPFGAKLDTVANLVFFFAAFVKTVAAAAIPFWLWIWAGLIAGIKLVNLISGFVVCRRFVAVHSVMNKIAGALLFLLPFALGFELPQQALAVFSAIVCTAATFAAIQEGHLIRTGHSAKYG